MKKHDSKLKILTNGLIKNNPTFRLVLGTCPTLAVTTSAINGLGMGLATTFVLICSNALISLLRKVIPDKVRIPAYVLIIATFVTIVQMVMRKYIPSLYESLGLFIPLIVVNCIILARAEAFASINPVGDSILDDLGIGAGFTVSLTCMGLLREFFGAGTFFGMEVGALPNVAMSVFVIPAGGFIMFGLLMALINFVSGKIELKRQVPVYEQTDDDMPEEVLND